jgi:hypothetical protein
MRLVRDELHAGEERGVVERRRDLRDAAAHGILETPVEDLRSRDESLLDGALAERLVQRKCLPGEDHRPVEQLGGTLDVRDPRLAARVVRGELRDELPDVELLGLFGREGRRGLPEPREMGRRLEIRHERLPDPRHVKRAARSGRDDRDAGSADLERRIARRRLVAPEPYPQRGAEALRVERDAE